MQKMRASSIVKGVGLGMAIGGATAMVGSTMMGGNTKKRVKRTANKAIKAVGDIADNLQYIFK